MMKKIVFFIVCCIGLHANDLSWGTPTGLSTLTLTASNPRIGMDSSGDLVAAWIENGNVVSNKKTFSGSWALLPTNVSGILGSVTSMELVVDPSGNATAIWNQGGAIQTAYMPSGGSWGSITTLLASGGSSPKISVNSSGNLAAVWINSSNAIQAATQVSGMSWSSVATISNSSSSSDSPQVTIGSTGAIVAVWHGQYLGIDTIFTNQTTLGTAWPTYPSLISTLGVPSVRPQVAINSLGAPIATWYTYNLSGTNYSNVYVQIAIGNADTTWNEPQNVSESGMRNPSSLVSGIAFDGNNVPFALWTNGYNASAFTLEGVIYQNGAWVLTSFLSSNIYLLSDNFMISPYNYIYAAYMEYNSTSNTPIIQAFKANTYNTSLNFGNVLTPSNGGYSGYPHIVGTTVGSTHSAAAIWLNNGVLGLLNAVQVSIATGVAIPAPTSLAVVQNSRNWDVFTEYYNTLTWSSSMPASTSNWVIFRNGVWLQTLPVATLTFVDDNAVQGQSVTYGVALQTQDGDLSPISTVTYP